jgi:ring-1,2-phenylacetyl-CoA epoxidase subunit PaaC
MNASYPINYYLLHLADTSLILSQRNSEWCGHGPILEQDIAITNISLDLLGQARNFYQYAAVLMNQSTNEPVTEDALAYLRTEREFKNLLLTEQPNGHWGQTILRQYFFSQFQYLLFQQLQNSSDTQLTAIATKALKEIAYHIRWSSEWVIRLGDGTEESRLKMIEAIDELWRYTGEFFTPTAYEKAMANEKVGYDVALLKQPWLQAVQTVLDDATLPVPSTIADNANWLGNGKEGLHTEHMGYILAELQYLQRAYPGAEW